MRRGAPLLLFLLLAGPAASAASLDIAKPLITTDGAQGCDTTDSLKRLLAASPGAVITGCLPIARGTRGYFLGEQGDEAEMIQLDIKADTRERVLWLPANKLRN